MQDWASNRIQTVSGCLGRLVQALDFSDDRLASLLDALGEDECCPAFETALNQHIVQVYDLCAERVRIDTPTTSGYWEVSEESLFQLGHSKNLRPGLPQVNMVLAALDSLGMPLVVQVVVGDRVDNPLYIPAMEQVCSGLERRGLLDVGNTKMMSLSTCAWLQAGQDHYLGSLSAIQVSVAALEKALEKVWSGEQALMTVARRHATGKRRTVPRDMKSSVTRRR